MSGRLGNVLLQIQFGQYLEKHYKVSCLYNCIYIDKSLSNTITKLYGNYILNKLICNRNTKGLSLYYLGFLRKFKFWPFYVEKEIDEIIEVIILKKFIFYTGYFQSHKYGSDLLFNQSNLVNLISTENFTRTNRLSSNDVVLHMRFGDFLDNKTKRYHSNLGISYYVNALKCFSGINRVIIITDNPDIALNKISRQIDYKTEIWSSPMYSTIDDFYTMTQSSNLIIGNSSFSYCAALQGRRLKKMKIVAPKNWFSSRSIDVNYRFPKSWKII